MCMSYVIDIPPGRKYTCNVCVGMHQSSSTTNVVMHTYAHTHTYIHAHARETRPKRRQLSQINPSELQLSNFQENLCYCTMALLLQTLPLLKAANWLHQEISRALAVRLRARLTKHKQSVSTQNSARHLIAVLAHQRTGNSSANSASRDSRSRHAGLTSILCIKQAHAINCDHV